MQIGNYRPISLTEILRKLFESLLMPHCVAIVEPLSVEQGGFRAKRGTMDQIATLQEWIVQSKAAKLPRHLAFLDIKAAYDQVDRSILWRKCAKKGMPRNLIGVLQALFDHNEAFVAINGHQSPAFPISCGVLQGSLMSPLLYSVFLDDLVEEINRADIRNGMSIGGRAYRMLLYADDIVLMSNAFGPLQRMLAICDAHARENRYRFSVAKCEVLSSEPPQRIPALHLHEQLLPVSKSFVYLGCTFAHDGVLWEAHGKRMGAKALSASNMLNAAGVNGRGLGISIALAVFRTFVRPVLEYCLALYPQLAVRRAQSTYNKCLSWLTSSGKGACSATTGLFGALEPFEARRERLGVGLWQRLRRLKLLTSQHFALVDANRAHQWKSVPGSVFTELEALPMVKARLAATNEARLLGRARPIAADLLKWEDRRELLLAAVSARYRSAYIFGGLDKPSRRLFVKAFSSLPPAEQQAIFLWCLNRAAGPWKVCRHCRTHPGTKAHLEACALQLLGDPTGPSLLEDQLRAGLTDMHNLSNTAQLIRTCIGDTPIGC
jgi:hypothetical protein